MDAFWLHCNKCFNEPANSRAKYTLTSCGHVLCSDCFGGGDCKVKCVCGSDSYQTQPLNSETPAHIRNFFVKTSTKIEELLRHAQFEKQHYESLVKHKKEQIAEALATAEHFKQKARDSDESVKKVQQTLEALRAEEEHLTRQLQNVAVPGCSIVSRTPKSTFSSKYSGFQASDFKKLLQSRLVSSPPNKSASDACKPSRSHGERSASHRWDGSRPSDGKSSVRTLQPGHGCKPDKKGSPVRSSPGKGTHLSRDRFRPDRSRSPVRPPVKQTAVRSSPKRGTHQPEKTRLPFF